MNHMIHRLRTKILTIIAMTLVLFAVAGIALTAWSTTKQFPIHTAYLAPFTAWLSSPTVEARTGTDAHLRHRSSQSSAPRLPIEPYIRPDLAQRMQALRPVILQAAARHNRPNLSGMSDEQFATTIALLMYNEHNGWLEDEVEILRYVTPVYEHMQVRVNQSGLGSDFSIWPTNLRPSVALEILRGQVPVPSATGVLSLPITVAGSRIVPDTYHSQDALFADITDEISQDTLGVEYLAANLERGIYRARYEHVPVNWRTLAAWHNQGIVQPAQVRQNAQARSYIYRTTAYLPTARCLIRTSPDAACNNEQTMPAEKHATTGEAGNR